MVSNKAAAKEVYADMSQRRHHPARSPAACDAAGQGGGRLTESRAPLPPPCTAGEVD